MIHDSGICASASSVQLVTEVLGSKRSIVEYALTTLRSDGVPDSLPAFFQSLFNNYPVGAVDGSPREPWGVGGCEPV